MQRHLASHYKPLTTDHVQWRCRQVAMSRITLIPRIEGLEQDLVPAPQPHVLTLCPARATPSALHLNVTAHLPPSLIPTALPAHTPMAKPFGTCRSHPLPTCTQEEGAPPLPKSHTGKTSVEIFMPNLHRDPASGKQQKVSNIRCGPAGVGLDRYLALYPLALVSAHHTHMAQSGKYRNMVRSGRCKRDNRLVSDRQAREDQLCLDVRRIFTYGYLRVWW
jgi:hypothetical protein